MVALLNQVYQCPAKSSMFAWKDKQYRGEREWGMRMKEESVGEIRAVAQLRGRNFPIIAEGLGVIPSTT